MVLHALATDFGQVDEALAAVVVGGTRCHIQDMLNFIATNLANVGAVVTAFATLALFMVTWVLAKETRRLARLTSQPQVVASIQTNPWGSMFADIHVQNTGNATAFDIQVAFDPPLTVEDPVEPSDPVPLQTISLLKPGQSLDSYLAPFSDIIDDIHTVTVSWKRDPADNARESLSYTVRVADIRGMSHLGNGDPVIQIADDIRKLREDFHKVATGWQKPKVDIVTSADRRKEREQRQREREERRREQEAQAADGGGSDDGRSRRNESGRDHSVE